MFKPKEREGSWWHRGGGSQMCLGGPQDQDGTAGLADWSVQNRCPGMPVLAEFVREQKMRVVHLLIPPLLPHLTQGQMCLNKPWAPEELLELQGSHTSGWFRLHDLTSSARFFCLAPWFISGVRRCTVCFNIEMRAFKTGTIPEWSDSWESPLQGQNKLPQYPCASADLLCFALLNRLQWILNFRCRANSLLLDNLWD